MCRRWVVKVAFRNSVSFKWQNRYAAGINSTDWRGFLRFSNFSSVSRPPVESNSCRCRRRHCVHGHAVLIYRDAYFIVAHFIAGQAVVKAPDTFLPPTFHPFGRGFGTTLPNIRNSIIILQRRKSLIYWRQRCHKKVGNHWAQPVDKLPCNRNWNFYILEPLYA